MLNFQCSTINAQGRKGMSNRWTRNFECRRVRLEKHFGSRHILGWWLDNFQFSTLNFQREREGRKGKLKSKNGRTAAVCKLVHEIVHLKILIPKGLHIYTKPSLYGHSTPMGSHPFCTANYKHRMPSASAFHLLVIWANQTDEQPSFLKLQRTRVFWISKEILDRRFFDCRLLLVEYRNDQG